MKFDVLQTPDCIIIDDAFSKEENGMILKEAQALKIHFKPAEIRGGKVDLDYRKNLYCDYDKVYGDRRGISPLLRAVGTLLPNKELNEIMATFRYPFTQFSLFNASESQVSSYNGTDYYNWHFDYALGSPMRMITLVYWFFSEPQRFKGGNFEISASTLYNRTLTESGITTEIEVKNNRAILMSCNTAHRVLPVDDEVPFEDSRFSINCWIGIHPKGTILEALQK